MNSLSLVYSIIEYIECISPPTEMVLNKMDLNVRLRMKRLVRTIEYLESYDIRISPDSLGSIDSFVDSGYLYNPIRFQYTTVKLDSLS